MFVSAESPNQQELYFELENTEAEITDMKVVDNLIYVFEDNRVWHVLDTTTKKKIARTPIEIAEEIHRPRFIPWHGGSFLIQETLRLNPEQFDRLWISSFVGVKKQVIDKFHETSVISDTPAL